MALGLVTVAILTTIIVVDSLTQQEAPPQIFRDILWLLLVLLILIIGVYWALVAFRLRYHLNRNGLTIQWGPTQYVIPFEEIQVITSTQSLAGPITFKGFNMAGLRFGWGETAEHQPLRFHTTAPLTNSLLVVTPEQAYVISPQSPEAFIKAWQVRQTIGPNQHWVQHMRHSWPLNTPIFTDRLAWLLLGLSGLACLTLLGYLAFTFYDLPSLLPIRFNALGEADRIADKSTLLLLPGVGAATLALNAVLGSIIYSQEKIAAYLLWGSTIVLELCLWVAMLQITT